MNRQLNKLLKHGVKVRIVNQDTKLSTRFEIKDQAKFEHRRDLVYYGKCPEYDCTKKHKEDEIKPF